jgi:hypothetical protein
MPKFQIYIGITAIAGLVVSCQPTPSTNPTSTPNNNLDREKATTYLRSQLKLSPNIAIVVESQKPNPANTSDLCQTTAPTQDGFEIVLIAEDVRYTLQTSQDASKIEVCRSEDAKPETTGKYNGAGYILRYPSDWKAIDLGLEPSGASTVIFTPSRDATLASESDLDKLLQNLQQRQQVYAIVTRQAIEGKAISDDSVKAKDLVTTPFDATIKGAKSGFKKEFTLAIANSSGSPTIWKVKTLALETEKFVYTVLYYQPDFNTDPNTSTSKAFEQFANSFALIQAQ